MVITAREQAERETYRRLQPLLDSELRTRLDQVLVLDTTIKRTPLVWLRQGSVSFSPAAIVGEIEKLSYVRALGVEHWDLSALTPNRRKFLAQVGKKSTNQALQRTAPSRRYPILVAFLRQVAENPRLSTAHSRPAQRGGGTPCPSAVSLFRQSGIHSAASTRRSSQSSQLSQPCDQCGSDLEHDLYVCERRGMQ